MSTEVTVKDLQSFNSAVASVRSDDDSTTWFVAGHVDNDPHLIDVVSNGVNLEDMYPHFADDQTMYALIRLEATIDMSTTIKFVYVKW